MRDDQASLRREQDTDKMWSTIDPLMHRRFEEAADRREKDARNN